MGKFSISDALGNAKAYYDERSSAQLNLVNFDLDLSRGHHKR